MKVTSLLVTNSRNTYFNEDISFYAKENKKERSIMKRKLLLPLLIFFGFIIVGCSQANGEEGDSGKRSVKIASVVANNTPASQSLRKTFIPYIEDNLPGKYDIQMYDSGVLGNETDTYAYTKDGSVDISLLGSSMYDEIPYMLATDFPFMFRDVEHAKKAYLNEFGDILTKNVAESQEDVSLLSVMPNGARVFSSNSPIEDVEDFKGQSMRMPNNPIHVGLAESLGANVVIMDQGEVFTALEQGVVDGQDNPLTTVRNEGWYEVQNYVYETNHIVAALPLFISNEFLDSIPKEHRAVFKEAAELANEEAWDNYVESIDIDKEFLQKEGIKIKEMTDSEREEMVETIQPFYDEIDSKYNWAEDIRETVENIKL